MYIRRIGALGSGMSSFTTPVNQHDSSANALIRRYRELRGGS
jgi:hypothetical protein